MAKIEKITKDKAAKSDKAGLAEKKAGGRARKLEKIEKASTVTFSLELPVRKFMDAQAKAAGMNLTHYMQKLVETHVIEAGSADEPLARRLAAKRQVIDQAVALATKLDAAGKFDEHFIMTVVDEAGKDAGFKAQYEIALGEDGEGNEAKVKRARVSLNQQIGRVIKKSVGARSKRNEHGQIARAQAANAFVATYTLLEKPAA
ncbi:hypothetical protein OS189_08525 [Sulfitobacter sp. F26169L]|uniref:hypothetical protein n=1 Tax=Sulfitobacter sp. F26169L TaxID=2996015 RepID=UPI002260A134|nr:hypothetical protein [Sulfitobacter sp. F26169L]MCX7566385.1 hypothetical protein [Sulfitobacter sp. F26169L]